MRFLSRLGQIVLWQNIVLKFLKLTLKNWMDLIFVHRCEGKGDYVQQVRAKARMKALLANIGELDHKLQYLLDPFRAKVSNIEVDLLKLKITEPNSIRVLQRTTDDLLSKVYKIIDNLTLLLVKAHKHWGISIEFGEYARLIRIISRFSWNAVQSTYQQSTCFYLKQKSDAIYRNCRLLEHIMFNSLNIPGYQIFGRIDRLIVEAEGKFKDIRKNVKYCNEQIEDLNKDGKLSFLVTGDVFIPFPQ